MPGAGTQFVQQTNFTGGQVDPILWRRTNIKNYLTGAQLLENMESSVTAVLKKRRGTKELGIVTGYVETDTVSFEFVDTENTYYLVIAVNEAFNIFKKMPDGSYDFYATVVTPYQSADLEELDFTTDADVLIFSHNDYPLSRLFVESYGPTTFMFEAINVYPQPAYDFGDIDYSQFAVTFTPGETATLQFTGLSGDPGFTDAWVGGQIISIGASPDTPAGYGIITAVSAYAAGSVTFTISTILTFGDTPGNKGLQFVVKQPVFTEALGYPITCAFYQNRLWVGGTRSLPQTVFGSKINAPANFDTGIGRDSDAVIAFIGVESSGASCGNILHINGGKQLEIYTERNEFVWMQDISQPLTAASLAIRPQSAYGSSTNFKPLTYLNDSFFVSSSGKAIMGFRFLGIGQAYASFNTSPQASLLVKNPIRRALQRSTQTSQDNYLYYLNDDNTITSFQFETGSKIASLSPILLNPDLQIIDLVSVQNQVLFIVKYTITNEYAIIGIDDLVKLDAYEEKTMGADGVITGLDKFNGYTVTVVYNGQDFGSYLVEDNEITVLDPPDEGEQVYVGLIYNVNIRTMFIYGGPNMMNAAKKVSKIYVDYTDSLAFEVNGAPVPYYNENDIMNDVPLTPQSGQFETGCADSWQREQTIEITQSAPFDLQIQSIAYQVAVTYI